MKSKPNKLISPPFLYFIYNKFNKAKAKHHATAVNFTFFNNFTAGKVSPHRQRAISNTYKLKFNSEKRLFSFHFTAIFPFYSQISTTPAPQRVLFHHTSFSSIALTILESSGRSRVSVVIKKFLPKQKPFIKYSSILEAIFWQYSGTSISPKCSQINS